MIVLCAPPPVNEPSGCNNNEHGNQDETKEKGDKASEVVVEGVEIKNTAAILSFMVQNSPVPIVMVGSQRSSDRPSSDAALNLMHSVKTAAESDIAEVMVCMFGPTSDVYGLLHRGTRVRKMHPSYRSTFRTIGDIPIAMVSREKIIPLRKDYMRRRADTNVVINTAFGERVSIVYYYPNMRPDIIDSLIDNDYRGIVIAGTGLRHVNKPLYPALKRAKEKNIAVYMTVQTLLGYVQPSPGTKRNSAIAFA